MTKAVDVLQHVVDGAGDETGASSSSGTMTPTTSAGSDTPSVARTTVLPPRRYPYILLRLDHTEDAYEWI